MLKSPSFALKLQIRAIPVSLQFSQAPGLSVPWSPKPHLVSWVALPKGQTQEPAHQPFSLGHTATPSPGSLRFIGVCLQIQSAFYYHHVLPSDCRNNPTGFLAFSLDPVNLFITRQWEQSCRNMNLITSPPFRIFRHSLFPPVASLIWLPWLPKPCLSWFCLLRNLISNLSAFKQFVVLCLVLLSLTDTYLYFNS